MVEGGAGVDGVAVVPLVASGGVGPSASDSPPREPETVTPTPTAATTASDRTGDTCVVPPAQGPPTCGEPLGGCREAVGSRTEAAVEQLDELDVAVVVSHATSTDRPSDRLSPRPDLHPVNPSRAVCVPAYPRRSWTFASSTQPRSPTTR